MENSHGFIYRYCAGCGFKIVVHLNCGDRLCPACKEANYYRLLRHYSGLIKKIPFLRLTQITLTYRNFSFLTKERVSNLGRDLKTLRRSKLFASSVKGGMAVIECKHVSDSAGWNLHVHLLVDAGFISQRELS